MNLQQQHGPIGTREIGNVVCHLVVIVSLLFVFSGCSGNRTFHEYARAGDTVMVHAGWMQNFTPDNITVTITPYSGADIVLAPGDPAIRAVTYLYPDPVSSIIVSRETGQNLTPYAQTYAGTTSSFTGGDKDWWQTAVFVDLPGTLPVGLATIAITNSAGEIAVSTLDIIEGSGSANQFNAESLGPMNPVHLDSLRRVSHYTVSFTGSTVPNSIQIDLAHDADKDNGGTGRTHLINPIGYIKNLAWSDDGVSTRVLLTPARGSMITEMHNFKFYVAGGIGNLNVQDVNGYDVDGNVVADITASIVSY